MSKRHAADGERETTIDISHLDVIDLLFNLLNLFNHEMMNKCTTISSAVFVSSLLTDDGVRQIFKKGCKLGRPSISIQWWPTLREKIIGGDFHIYQDFDFSAFSRFFFVIIIRFRLSMRSLRTISRRKCDLHRYGRRDRKPHPQIYVKKPRTGFVWRVIINSDTGKSEDQRKLRLDLFSVRALIEYNRFHQILGNSIEVTLE